MNRFFKILVMGLLVLTGAFFIYNSSNLQPSANSNVRILGDILLLYSRDYAWRKVKCVPPYTRSLDFKVLFFYCFII